MDIEVSGKEIYGRTLYYPVNKAAVGLCEYKSYGINRTIKTFTREQLDILEKHGFNIKEVTP
jgi:hypothetical protein